MKATKNGDECRGPDLNWGLLDFQSSDAIDIIAVFYSVVSSSVIPRSPFHVALSPVLIRSLTVHPERKRYIAMAGLVANFTRRDARLQGVDAIAMAQVMDAETGDAGPVAPRMQGVINTAARYRARAGQKQCRRPAPGATRMQEGQPAGEYPRRLLSQEYLTVLFPLAQYNDTATLNIHVTHSQISGLRGTQAAGIDYPKHGMVPGGQPAAGSGVGVYCLEKSAECVFWNSTRHGVGRSRGRQIVKRVGVKLAPPHCPGKENVERTVVTVNRGVAQFLLSERQEKCFNLAAMGRPGTKGKETRQGIAVEFAGCRTSASSLAADDEIIKRHGGGRGKEHRITSLYHKTAAVKFAVVLQNNSF